MVAAPAWRTPSTGRTRLKSLHVGLHLVLIDAARSCRRKNWTAWFAATAGSTTIRCAPGCAFSSDPARAAGSRPRSAPNSRRSAPRISRSTMSTRTSTCTCIRRWPGWSSRSAAIMGCGRCACRSSPEAYAPGFSPASVRRAAARLRGRGIAAAVAAAGLAINDHVFGVAWSGAMTEDRILGLLPHLPEGVSEIYFHPATEMSSALRAAMPGYRPARSLPRWSARLCGAASTSSDIRLVSYGRPCAHWLASPPLRVRLRRRSLRRAEQGRQDHEGAEQRTGERGSSTARPCRRCRDRSTKARLPNADNVVSALNSTARAVLDWR